MTLSVFHIMAEKFCSIYFYNVASVHWDLKEFVYEQLSFTDHCNTLILDSSFFQPFCYKFAAWPTFRQALSVRQMTSHLTLKYFVYFI